MNPEGGKHGCATPLGFERDPANLGVPSASATAGRDKPTCRETVAFWPLAYRERWGRLAAELEASGVPWPRSEWDAFDQTDAELRAAEDRGLVPESSYPDVAPPLLSDAEAVAAIDRAFGQAGPVEHRGTARGPRDARRGDRWLPWHNEAPAEDDRAPPEAGRSMDGLFCMRKRAEESSKPPNGRKKGGRP